MVVALRALLVLAIAAFCVTSGVAIIVSQHRPSLDNKRAVRDAIWEDASASSIAEARACLPSELQALYVPNLTLATQDATDPNAKTECEQLILFVMYEDLNSALSLCRSLSDGMRLCEHYINVYKNEKGLNPAAMPRISMVASIQQCEAAIHAVPGLTRREIIRAEFRYRFANGTNCLRAKTIFGNLPTFATGE